MKQTVIIVDDEEHLREAVAEYLDGRGLRVLTAASAAEFRELVRRESFQVAILDIAMPGEDGLSLARWLRQWPERPGVIFATASSTPVDRIVGLEIGADDYVVKPFDLRELLARIRSLLRRLPSREASAPEPQAATRTARVGPHTINLDARRLIDASGRAIELTPTEFDLLAYLMARPGRVCPRDELLEHVWGYPAGTPTRTLAVHVAQLRSKLGDAVRLRTVRGVGYSAEP